MTPVKIKVSGNRVLVGFVEGVTILKNGVVVGDTNRIDFVEGNNVGLEVIQKGKRIQVKVTATGSGGGGGLNATVSGGVELTPGTPGNITLGGPLIRDVSIGGAGIFGIRWGIPDSLLKFFSVFGNAWSMVLDDDRLYFKSAGDVGFEGEEGAEPVWFNNFTGMVIGDDTMNGSAILQLVSDSKAFLLNVLSNIANVNSPAQGMMVGSAVEQDVLIYWNNVWTGVTRPKIIVTAETNFVVTEAHRNAVIVMTGVGEMTATWSTGLSKGHNTFIFKKSIEQDDTIELKKGGNANMYAFNTKIYVGGAAVVNAGDGELYVSGSLGPFVNAADITAAIIAAEVAAKAYADDIQGETIACSDETTAITVGTAKATFRMRRAATLVGVRASLTTAQASGNIFTVDINKNGTSIMTTTKITIDNTETTSKSAATQPVLTTTALADDDEITIDVDQIGNGTAKGLKVYLIFG